MKKKKIALKLIHLTGKKKIKMLLIQIMKYQAIFKKEKNKKIMIRMRKNKILVVIHGMKIIYTFIKGIPRIKRV
jgi:hypothetical protein